MSVIKTGAIIESQYFKEVTWIDKDSAIHQKCDMSDKDWYEYFFDVETMSDGEKERIENYRYSRTLQEEGLTLPDNVVIIGTVNMDDTTHQFSRKVIDRAMTIEMNGGNFANIFGGSKNLEYLSEEKQKEWQSSFSQRYVTADEVIEAHPNDAEDLKNMLPAKLQEINKALRGTPFEVSYRVLNEFAIMVGVMLDDNKENQSLEDIINQAVNNILLMKILPRIEGDADMFALSKKYKDECGIDFNDRLEWLEALAPDTQTSQEENEHPQSAREKIQEMRIRLENQEFTRFWP